ncbi:phosphoribosyltransferase [Candidatus Uhrbacteria bacterium]|nr:phosphoribosyltransferase [Candidatus Uhrbacteria bacterium]
MDEREVLQALATVGAVIRDSHLVYASGKHGSAYVNKDAVYPYPVLTSRLCRVIAERFAGDRVDAVIAPAIGGVILSQWTAFHLSQMFGNTVFGVYAEKSDAGVGLFSIRRGYDRLISGKRVLVVEDVLTTGASAKGVVREVRSIGGDVVGVGALCNRGGITKQDLGEVPALFALVNVTLDAWEESECPLCAERVPINTDVGYGKSFLRRKQTSRV